MKKKYILIAIALLVVINISALTTLGYNRYCQYKESCDCSEANTICTTYLCENLGLSTEQIAHMETVRNSFILEMQKSSAALKTKRLRLIDLLNKDIPDTKKIDKICGEVNSIQADLQKKVISNILKEKNILTEEQRNRYLSIIKSRILLDNSSTQPDMLSMEHEDCQENCEDAE